MGSLFFTSLPEDVLRRIIDFLLSSAEVKKTWLSPSVKDKFYCTTVYDFQLAIMRTNTALHAIASEVFLNNHFVLITSNNGTLRHEMNENRVQFWDVQLETFKNYRLHLQSSGKGYAIAAQRRINNITNRRTSFLICSDGLEDFVNMLRTYESLVNMNEYCMSFRLNTKGMRQESMPLKLQQRLLEPFMRLRTSRQTCSIAPSVDEDLAKRLQASVTPQVFWFRAQGRELYNVILHERLVADAAFDAGQIEVAARLYDNAADIVQNARRIGLKINRADDEVFWNDYHDLILSLRVMVAMAFLLHADSEVRRAKDHEFFRKILRISLDTEPEYNCSEAGIMLYCGLVYAHLVAYVALEDTTKLWTLLLRVRKMHSFNIRYNDSVNIAKIWANTHSKLFGATPPYPQEELSTLLAVVPNQAVRHVPMIGAATSASIDRERYVLRSLGYDGDLLEERIVQKVDCSMQYGKEVSRPFDKKVADKMVKSFQKDIARQKSKGKIPAVWIESSIEEK
jgi:hypothetical protein